jgi:acyl dehydratase
MMSMHALHVTPAAGLPGRYAEIAGDHNPIHTDAEFARAAGLPGVVLHGLYTMALVARAVSAEQPPLALRALEVQFRSLAVPGEEITVSCTAHPPEDGRQLIEAEARQGDARVIRRGRAELRVQRLANTGR